MAANFYGPPRTDTPTTNISDGTPIPYFVAEAVYRQAVAKEEVCPITFTPFSECEQVVMTLCFHMFEKESLLKCLGPYKICPTCRKKVFGWLDIKKKE